MLVFCSRDVGFWHDSEVPDGAADFRLKARSGHAAMKSDVYEFAA
jgi:hypothetical protein